MKKDRIWELDAFRGLCIICMLIVHFIYDLVDLYRLVPWTYPPAFLVVKDWGGLLFLVLSGICVTLGSRSVRRGILVILGGLLCTLVTVGMYLFDFAGRSIIIYFGVLHCLGCCMLLWPLFRKLPTWALAVLGVAMTAVGIWLKTVTLTTIPWLVPFGLTFPGFASSDYFPLLPNLGYFLLGAVMGRTVYGKKQTRFPGVSPANPLRRGLTCVGRNSLWIYLLHQPIYSAILELWVLIR